MEQQVTAIHQQVLKQTNKTLFSSNTQAKNFHNTGIYPLLSFSLATMDFKIQCFLLQIAPEVPGEMLVSLVFVMSPQSGSSEEKKKLNNYRSLPK